MAIYTHDEAARIVELFENVLGRYGIKVPSPEDDQRGEDNDAKLYGSVYGELLDGVEDIIVRILDEEANGANVIPYVFSGRY